VWADDFYSPRARGTDGRQYGYSGALHWQRGLIWPQMISDGWFRRRVCDPIGTARHKRRKQAFTFEHPHLYCIHDQVGNRPMGKHHHVIDPRYYRAMYGAASAGARKRHCCFKAKNGRPRRRATLHRSPRRARQAGDAGTAARVCIFQRHREHGTFSIRRRNRR